RSARRSRAARRCQAWPSPETRRQQGDLDTPDRRAVGARILRTQRVLSPCTIRRGEQTRPPQYRSREGDARRADVPAGRPTPRQSDPPPWSYTLADNRRGGHVLTEERQEGSLIAFDEGSLMYRRSCLVLFVLLAPHVPLTGGDKNTAEARR